MLLARVTAVVQELAANVENWQVVAVASIGLLTYLAYRHHVTKIDIPSFGVPEGLFGPWKAAFAFITQSDFLVREGYRKYGKQGKAFKLATPARYLVLLSDPKMIKELAQIDDNIMSFTDSAQERISFQYSFAGDLIKMGYHMDIIRDNLTNKLSSILPEAMSELVLAFEENTKIGPEWTGVDSYGLMLKCISRTTNRLLVGLPLCRDEEYLKHCVEFATKISRIGSLIDMFPKILKPIVARAVFSRNKALNKVVAVTGPIFEERRRKLRELGDAWTDRPSDAIQWIAEAAYADSTIENMCRRILFLNFVSIHTTSFAMVQVMHDLASAPELQEPLRAEIESVVEKFGGWTKQALTAMKKLDSVLRESQRLNGLALVTCVHKAMVPHTFSDGTFVPKGSWVGAPTTAVHQDADLYENATEFDGFRFARIREQPNQGTKHQMVSVTDDYLAFGVGRHACPGRFFAANQLKLFLAYIILNYELKPEIDGHRPPNRSFAYSRVPDLSAGVMFRERKDRKQSFANSLIPVERV